MVRGIVPGKEASSLGMKECERWAKAEDIERIREKKHRRAEILSRRRKWEGMYGGMRKVVRKGGKRVENWGKQARLIQRHFNIF